MLPQHDFSSADEIYEDLLRRLINLELYPGKKTSENQLAEEYNVSRSVIRHASIRLVEANFLEVLPNRGTYVSLIQMDYIKDVFFLRTAFEKEIVRTVIRTGSYRSILDKLKENIEQQRAYEKEIRYIEEFRKLDSVFHSLIANAAEIKNYEELLRDHSNHMERWKNLIVTSEKTLKKVIDSHEKIYLSIRDADEEKAIDAIEYHLNTIADHYMDQLEKFQKDYLRY